MECDCGEMGSGRSSGGLLLPTGARRKQCGSGGYRAIQGWLQGEGRLKPESDVGGTSAAGDFRD